MKNSDARKHVQPTRIEPRGIPRDEEIIGQVLTYIIDYKTAADGNSPSLDDIAQGCELSSKSLANYYLFILESQGRITIMKNAQGNNLARSICIPGGKWTHN